MHELKTTNVIGFILDISDVRMYPGRLSFLPVEPFDPEKLKRIKTDRPRMTRSQSEYKYPSQSTSRTPRSQSFIEVESVLKRRTEEDRTRKESVSNVMPNGVDEIEEDLERVTVNVAQPSDNVAQSTSDGQNENSLDVKSAGSDIKQSDGDEVNSVKETDKEGKDSCDTGQKLENAQNENSATLGADGGYDMGLTNNSCKNSHVSTNLMPPLSEPVPSNWVTLEDDFVVFVATYQSHLSHDVCVNSEACLDDGVITLGMVRNQPGSLRKKLLTLMLTMEDGSQTKEDFYEMINVKAFRLEPLNDKGGHLCVDGELVKYGPIQAQILPSMARVMATKRE